MVFLPVKWVWRRVPPSTEDDRCGFIRPIEKPFFFVPKEENDSRLGYRADSRKQSGGAMLSMDMGMGHHEDHPDSSHHDVVHYGLIPEEPKKKPISGRSSSLFSTSVRHHLELILHHEFTGVPFGRFSSQKALDAPECI
ncbi:hypothetical protein RUM43_001332 [Polyplax serrata]|uniref:Uncharacterized protein n=1 Tax=Polyplax serrata TaxID=468196 RepID=A0AAN8XRX8_POLSC